MFRQLFDLWHRDDLLSQAFNDASDMLHLAKELFCKATTPLFTGEPVDNDMIYSTDRKINVYEIKVRRKVLEHLSISPQQDTTAALVLITITVDIERLGDYAKNFFELWGQYGGRFIGVPVLEKLKEINDNVTHMFEDTSVAFDNADYDLARKVMDDHIVNAERCEGIIAEMAKTDFDDLLSCNQMVLAALAARYLKRMSAHLKNIASSVINPFDRIGYKPPNSDADDEVFDD